MMGTMTRTKGHMTVSASDGAVIVAGASAMTVNWWGDLITFLPDVAQGIIVLCTVVFVVVRAIREVSKFISDWQANRRGDQE